MCRWIVYQGPPTFMSRVLLDSGHSLLDQSLQATHIEWPTNGDGFGVGWYDRRTEPGLFRDVLPIWNDTNFAALAGQIESPLFFAHVRRSTTGAIQRTNCHPFAHGGWMFQHNGSIPSFPELKQGLYAQIAPELFPHLHGSTDSECMFLLAMSHGLRDDPPEALAAMIRIVEAARRAARIEAPFRCTSAVSDGNQRDTSSACARMSASPRRAALKQPCTIISGEYDLIGPAACSSQKTWLRSAPTLSAEMAA